VKHFNKTTQGSKETPNMKNIAITENKETSCVIQDNMNNSDCTTQESKDTKFTNMHNKNITGTKNK